MTNLLRKCENCVYGRKSEYALNRNEVLTCDFVIPNWMREYLEGDTSAFVRNTEAERCEAFRLRDVGEN